MGTRPGAVRGAAGRERRALALAFAVAVVMLLLPGPAGATFHEMSVREVYSGTSSNSSYVVLQMYTSGQNFVSGHFVRVYNASGSAIGTFTFSGSVPNGESQRTILVGDDGVQSAFGLSPDLVSSSFDIPAAGGAVCFESIDCVSWGSFSGSLPSAAGTPEAAIPAGMAIRRSISGGTCTGQLDAGDDSDDSSTDFSAVSPQPRNNASAIVEGSCSPSTAPNTTIGTKPSNPTSSTSATFTFTATPSSGATFECRLDAEPEFTACTSPREYTGLAGGAGTSHTFRVRAVHSTNGTDSTPAIYTWTVDTVAPTATIGSHPPDPGPGNSAAFTYSSSEGGSTFQCSLVPEGEPDSFSTCPLGGKTYPGPLADGGWTFKVRAKDKAGNEGAADEFTWQVDHSLNDTTPPETTILSKPPDPDQSTTASFTYASNEPGSSFECKLDDGAFAACDPGGVTYVGLVNGSHSFQVRARDPSGNLDPSVAGYSWSVATPTSEPPPPAPSPLAPPAVRPTLETTITRKPKAVTTDRTPTFRFRSDAAVATFECKIDRGAFLPCASPFTTKRLRFGVHTLQVRAVSGVALDPIPARSTFRVVKPASRRGSR